jgi:outer membrane biosynthesis protein TonB
VALRHALAEAQAQLAHIDAEHIGDAKLSAELAALRREVASLPRDPAIVALVSGVENLIAQAPGETGGAEPSSPAPAGGGDATAAPAESPGATPEPTPEASPQPTPEPAPQPTPEPTPPPAADAPPADAQPTPDASPTPDNSVAMTGDRTPPY